MGIGSNKARKAIYEKLKEYNIEIATLVHQSAVVSCSANIEEGSVVMPRAVIEADARIGVANIINSGAIVGSDCVLDNFVHISPGATLDYGAKIGCCTQVGTGAVVINNVRIEQNCIIGASAVIDRDIRADSTVVKNAKVVSIADFERGYNTELRARIKNKKHKQDSLKIGYFADGIWAHEALKLLLSDDNIVISFVCLRFDSQDTILQHMAKENNIDCFTDENINSSRFVQKISNYECDLFVSMSFNQIFKKQLYELPRLKTINCHAGKLPFYRGRNILNWVLINNEKEFGITAHYIDDGIDTGDIILQKVYPIAKDDTYETILKKSHKECAGVIYEAIKMISRYDLSPISQSSLHSVGLYCPQRKEGDEKINWDQTSLEIFNFIRALCAPAVMARSNVKGKEITINKVEIFDCPVYKAICGAVIGKERDGTIIVKTKDTAVKILEYTYNGIIKVGDRFE